MMVWAVVLLSLAVIAGAAATLWARNARSREVDALREQVRALSVENARLQQQVESSTEEYRRLTRESEERFRLLATEALSRNSESISRMSRESMDALLAPMRREIQQFSKSITDSYDREARERFALDARIRELVQLNQTIGAQTQKLTTALQGGAKIQGNWGEMVLENILETSGLRPGLDFTKQTKFATDDPSHPVQPDVVIRYTESRRLIVDSKVSISAYLRMVDATDEEMRREYGRQHLASVTKHISTLSTKKYQDYVSETGADFVLMFIPNEGAFIAAMRLDAGLWEKAYNQRVLLISPTHLMSVVKLVGQIWRHDRQNRNALMIAREATAMVSKFQAMLDDLTRLQATLGTAQRQWDAIQTRITGRGGVMSRFKRLHDLGIKARKDYPASFPLPEGDADESGIDFEETTEGTEDDD